MTSNLAFLQFKGGGIQRDGTTFQGDYCIDGFWTRFYRGKPKKIGGMKAPYTADATSLFGKSTSDILLTSNANNQIFYYLATTTGIFAGTLAIDSFDVATANNTNLIPTASQNNITSLTKWQSQIIVNKAAAVTQVAFLATNNATNISDTSAAYLFAGKILYQGRNPIQLETTPPALNGGMCWAQPYLFLYGLNGKVQYSTNNNPYDFSTTGENIAARGGELTISSDKVIYAAPIRGGTYTPTVLFWTLSSLVSLANVGDAAGNVAFKKNVISMDCSILSSKCVIEYNGFFFWPGSDGRFFVYNGIVTEMVNNMNLKYFFDNIDMDYRQKVFGVINPENGEMWWFYPEKLGTPGRMALAQGANTRALVYNRRENFWYDTAISRDCGVSSEAFGIMCTYGLSLTNPIFETSRTFLWRHEETNPNEVIQGATMNNPISSYFTTPVFGWSCFNPVTKGAPPIDRWTDLKRIEPDFKFNSINDTMTIVVNKKEYAQDIADSTVAITFTGGMGKVDMRVQARQMTLTFSSDFNFEMGNVVMTLAMGDGR